MPAAAPNAPPATQDEGAAAAPTPPADASALDAPKLGGADVSPLDEAAVRVQAAARATLARQESAERRAFVAASVSSAEAALAALEEQTRQAEAAALKVAQDAKLSSIMRAWRELPATERATLVASFDAWKELPAAAAADAKLHALFRAWKELPAAERATLSATFNAWKVRASISPTVHTLPWSPCADPSQAADEP